MRKILLLVPLFLSFTAQAEVYRWVDKAGVAHYTDQPPSKDAKPAVLPPLQTISTDAADAARNGNAAAAGAAAAPKTADAAYKLSVLSPAADATVRSAERSVAVSVAVDKPMPDGAGFIYYLDGRAQNSVGAPTSFVLTGVERGSHLVAVAMVDAGGRELARSAPVIVHMKPPTIN